MNTGAYQGRSANITRCMAVAALALATACGTDSGSEKLARAVESPTQPSEKPSLVIPKQLGAAHVDSLILVPDTKLLASDGMGNDFFGTSVSLSGDTALIGAPADDDIGEDSGSAYVFVRSGNTWIQQAKLVANDGAMYDYFGTSVSLSGDIALIGVPTDDGIDGDSGSAYVFVRSGNTWTQQAKLVANDGAAGDGFGTAVSLSGNMALVGAILGDGNDFDTGAAYVFVRNGNTWTQEAKLGANGGVMDDGFGAAVSLSADMALVTASSGDGNDLDSGTAYVFVRNGNTWTQEAKLEANDGAYGDRFGAAVSLSKNTALVGADNDLGASAAYVFVHEGNTWTEQAKLLASDGAASYRFGRSVSVEGNTALVGATGANALGAAYVFIRNGDTWTEYAKVVENSPAPSAFGASVSQSGYRALVGAPSDQPSGAAYSLLLPKTNGETCVLATECANGVCIAGFCGNPTGSSCAADTECRTGFCTDGFCCNSACGKNDVVDCQVCSEAAGAVKNGTCTPVAMGLLCRSSMGVCDIRETCNGVDGTCPADNKVAAGTECRAAEGVCTAAESCNGESNDCPADVDLPNGSLCPGGLCAGTTCILDPIQPPVEPEETSCTCRAAGSSSPHASFASLGLLGLALLVAHRRQSTNHP